MMIVIKRSKMYSIDQFVKLAGLQPANMTKSSPKVTKSSKNNPKSDDFQKKMTKRKS